MCLSERKLQLISIPAAQCLRTPQLSLVFPRTPPLLVFLRLHPSSTTLSLCHLLSRRSSLSCTQVCTGKCFQIGTGWSKGMNLSFHIPRPGAEVFSDLEEIYSSAIPQTLTFLYSLILPYDTNAHFVKSPAAVKSFAEKEKKKRVQPHSANVSHF